MTLTRVGQVRPDTIEDLRAWCQGMISKMTSDVSSYTDTRYRVWLFNECNLSNGEIIPAYYDERLWKFCQYVYPGCNIGLLTFGGKFENVKSDGLIRPHRDHQYAQPIARTVNLGKCLFGYDGKVYELNDGDITQFNCKRIHSVDKILSDERFSICLWKLNEAKGYVSKLNAGY
ncbi:MAG TPA: hypothetical protein VK203_10755 [Nostocaceae cyanobacterium]|nr:hypothetical protein [Nostocaceae cyanobacterium]